MYIKKLKEKTHYDTQNIYCRNLAFLLHILTHIIMVECIYFMLHENEMGTFISVL